MTREDYINLFEKSLTGSITPDEEVLLERYSDAFRLEELPWDRRVMGDREATKAEIFTRLEPVLPSGTGGFSPVRRMNRIRWSAAAAVLLLLAGTGWYIKVRSGVHPVVADAGKAGNGQLAVLPGSDKATLTLSDGTVIALDKSGNGKLLRNDEHSTTKMESGKLVYQTSGSKGQGQGPAGAMAVSWNTVATPRGGQYQVVLPDGTKVWLNATSSLRFPTRFTGAERKVELTGEGYFAVAKDVAHPFRVAVRDMDVEVLGTEFNVMAYTDEAAIHTTLLEGSVRLRNGGKSWLMRPGQDAGLTTAGQLQLKEDVDVDAVTAWKNGRFEFYGNIQGIMRQIARWYDVDVKYEGNVTDKAFGGAVMRTADVSEVLKILELTGSIHFSINGRTITVQP